MVFSIAIFKPVAYKLPAFLYAGGQKKRKKGFIKMHDSINPNNFRPAVFPADLMYDPKLSMSERMVMIILYSYTNAHTNTAFPSYQTIADRAAITRSAAIQIVKRLISKEYIIKQENFRKSKAEGKMEQTSNLYTLSYQPRTKKGQGGSNRRLP